MSRIDAAPEPPPEPAIEHAIDERVLSYQSGYEAIDGIVERAITSGTAYAITKARLALLLGTHVDARFEVASDLYIRTSELADIRLDASVFPRERDAYGGRALDAMAFRISADTSKDAAPARLIARGVRRVFAIDLAKRRLFEWACESVGWSDFSDPTLVDEALAIPLPVAALLDTNLAVAAIEDARLRGHAEALLAVLEARGLSLQPAERARLLRERDPERLARWAARIAGCTTVAELLAT